MFPSNKSPYLSKNACKGVLKIKLLLKEKKYIVPGFWFFTLQGGLFLWDLEFPAILGGSGEAQ